MKLKKGTKVYVTHAYDGSGVALRAVAEVLQDFGKTARVKFTGEAPHGHAKVDVVDKGYFTALGTYPDLASFGWLD